jgi:hypothetical protein
MFALWRYNTMKCPRCDFDASDHAKFCTKCGYKLNAGNENDVVGFWKLPLTLIILFFISIFDLPYGFYEFLRLIVCLFSVVFAFFYFCCKDSLSFASITAIAIAILWNPVMPVTLDKETWVCLDIIAIVLESIMLYLSYQICKESK